MEIKVIVDNRIRLNYKDLPKEMFRDLKDSLTYKNPDYLKNKRLGYSTIGISQFMTSYEIEKSNMMTIARGASYKLKDIARVYGVKIKFVDKRVDIPYNFNTSIVLRDYQLKPCDQLVHFQNSLIQGVCGCGKTVILLKAIENIGQKTLIIVHERKLQQQWIDNIKAFFDLPEDQIGIIGGVSNGKNRVRPITVAMQQSLLKNAHKYANDFGCVVGDEVHRFAASTFQKVIDSFPAKYRIGATATPKRKDGKHDLVFDQFGKIVSQITDDDLLELGMTHDVKIVVVKTEFEYTGKMEKTKSKIFRGNDEDGNARYEEVEAEYVNNNELLEQLIMDKDRNNLIFRFLNAEVNNNNYCILLADRRRFCLNWKRWLGYKDIEAKLLVGGAEHKEEGDDAIKRIMTKGDLHVVIGTTVADEGLDIKRLNRGFSATPTATNERRIVQQVGRIKRKCEGKDDAIWYYFLDEKVKGYDKHLKLLRKYFKTVEVLEDKYQIDEYLHHLENN